MTTFNGLCGGGTVFKSGLEILVGHGLATSLEPPRVCFIMTTGVQDRVDSRV